MKHYIKPESLEYELQAEHLIALSSQSINLIDSGTDAAPLSNKRSEIWDNDLWGSDK